MSQPTARVLVASRDGDYRRLAAAALAAAGFDVHTVVARTERIERMVLHREPDVLVLDASPGSAAVIDAFVRALPHPPAVVHVSDRDDRPDGSTEKWCSPAALVDAVVTASRPTARHLYIVR